MKKIFIFLIPFSFILFTVGFSFAQLNAPKDTSAATPAPESLNTSTPAMGRVETSSDLDFGTEEIANYDIKIEIQKDSTLLITENILYDFKSLQRHGIYRDIPYKYKDRRGANYNLRLKVLLVTDENGTAYTYKTSRKEKNFSIKIGDPDKLVTGKKTYIIKYQVERGMRYFKDHDELYWNAIGTGWGIPILAGKAEIILPKGLPADQIKYDCFTGVYGSTTKNCQIKVKDQKTVEYLLTEPLGLYSGMTIVLGVPKGTVQRIVVKEIKWFLLDNWPLLLIPFSFIILSILWWRRGRDPKGKGTIIAQYDPPDNLRPAQVGTIVDQDVDNSDVSATLIDLAVRGYLKIKEITKGEYHLVKLKEESDSLEDFEKELLDGIFGKAQTKLLSALKNQFATKLTKIKETIYNNVTTKGYFPKNPESVRIAYTSSGGIIAGASIFLGIFLQSMVYLVGFLFSGILLIVFGFFMSRRSHKGVLACEHILGFREFLSVTERERLKFHQAPEKKPELFERYLPYAMVLKVESEWARQFEGIYQQKPSFYESYDNRLFAPFAFVSVMNNLSTKTSDTFTSVPPKTSSGSFGGSGFGGGGFSGGGGGGGGGGSW